MNKKLYFYFLIIGSLLSSCVSVYFDQPQPKGGELLTNFPKEFQGKWLGDDDTIYINSNCVKVYEYITDSVTMLKETKLTQFCLSDSIQLYKAGDYYVANLKNKEQGWEIYVFEFQKNGDLYSYYPSTSPFMGKGHGLKVEKVISTPIDASISEGSAGNEIVSKSIQPKDNETINTVYYKGQFRIKDIHKIIKEENTAFKWVFVSQ